MSVSPWKKVDVLNRIGRALGRKYGLRFVESDFKKKGGFQKSVELSRAQGLYRQDYCGCKPSWRLLWSQFAPGAALLSAVEKENKLWH